MSVFLLLKISCAAQSYGLSFNSHETVLEKRTALEIGPGDSLCFNHRFEFSFDLNFLQNYQVYFGYVLRIVSNNNENIDLIYNQPTSSFQVIAGEHFSGIRFNIDNLHLFKEWNHISIQCDLDKQKLLCTVNNKLIGASNLAIHGNCFKFLLGANDFQKFKTRDLPPMQIKDIRIVENNQLAYYWALNETAGTVSYDKIHRKQAVIKNPVWIKIQHQKWESVGSFTTKGYAGVAFDDKHDKLYIAGSDSIAAYTLKNGSQMEWLPANHQNLLLGHQNIYDTLSNKLFDSYIDHKKAVFFDFQNGKWDFNFPSGHVDLTKYWHSNKFISKTDTSLYFIGGYGYLRYNNLVQRYHFASHAWETLTPTGDYFTPRYLAALGTDAEGEFAYILGGYGSQTGDQMLDPKYYDDLFRYDIKKNAFKKIGKFKSLNNAFTFANSLIADSAGYYALIFANDSYHSSLQLVRGFFKDSVLHQLGNAIPYNFHDVQSFADLYYSSQSNKLIAVTLFYSPEDVKEQKTEVKIYALNFPPEPPDSQAGIAVEPVSQRRWWWWLLPAIVIVTGFILLVRKKWRVAKPVVPTYIPAVQNETLPVAHEPVVQLSKPQNPPRSSIYLFGQFQVYDRECNDITRLFTPLLKELFLILAIYTIRNGRGISSEALNELLWHNKSEKDANNNRSVNIVKLKIILEKIGNCTIDSKSGYTRLLLEGSEMYIDYKEYISLSLAPAEQERVSRPLLLNIIKRGAFLAQTEYGWLDDIKSEIANFVINSCLGLIKSLELSKDSEFIIELTSYIFCFDKLNEDALIYKCKCLIFLKRLTQANTTYQKFIKEYKDIYGEDFGKPFQHIIN